VLLINVTSTPDPTFSPAHLSIWRGRATTTHYTHHQVCPMVSRNTTLSPFPGVAHWASLWGRPQRWHAKGACVTPNKKEERKIRFIVRMPEPDCFLRYRIGYGTLQPCLGCQQAALLREFYVGKIPRSAPLERALVLKWFYSLSRRKTSDTRKHSAYSYWNLTLV